MDEEDSGVRGPFVSLTDCGETSSFRLGLVEPVDGNVDGNVDGIGPTEGYSKLVGRFQPVERPEISTFGSAEANSVGTNSGEVGLARRFFEGPLYPRREGV